MIPAEAVTPEQPSLGTGILGGVIGAVIISVVTLVVQLYIVPRVDARRRREERWERDVLALGEYLTDVVSERARAAQSAVGMVAFLGLKDIEDDADPDRLAEARTKAAKEAREGCRAFDESVTRCRWLCDRVVYLNSAISVLMAFGIRAMRWERKAMLASMHQYGSADADKVSEAWASERKAREELIAKVKDLALGSAPRATPRDRASDLNYRASQRLHRLADKFRRTDADGSGESAA